jgi:dienelactone hydrolase
MICALALALTLSGQVRSLKPADSTPLATAVLDDVEARAQWLLAHQVKHARSAAEADSARRGLRAQLLDSLGVERLLWPPRLGARVTGTLRRAGYRIEKVVYQSLPGVDVPAHLYLPEGLTGRAPTILFYNGHWYADSKAWPDFQKFCVNMARLGFVVFTFDPFGQGERGISTRDHRRVSGLLARVAQQGFAEYETRCAMEYLLSRKEVDPERIGMTGASGGGFNTWINSSLDDRIKVAVPVVGTSEFALQVRFARSNDWYSANEHCHFIPRLFTYADNRELVAMIAPRPLLIINSTTDRGFPIGNVADYARELYNSYGQAERFGFVHDSTTGHGYQQAKREAAYGWFLKWLKGEGDGRPRPEPETPIEPTTAPELRAFEDGWRHPAGPGMEAMARSLAARPARGEPLPLVAAPPVKPVAIADKPVQRLELPSWTTVPAFLVKAERQKGVLVAVDDRGKDALMDDPLVQRALAEGWAICGVDPRGIGELDPGGKGFVFSVSLLSGDNFVARQAGDLKVALRAFEGQKVALYARGDNAALVATYLIGSGARLEWYALRNGFLDYSQFLDRPGSRAAADKLFEVDDRTNRLTAFDREIPYFYYPWGMVSLPAMLERSRARGYVMEPIDGDWKPIEPEAARKLLPAKVKVLKTGELPPL